MKEAFCAGSAQYMEEYLNPPLFASYFSKERYGGGVGVCVGFLL